MLLDDSIDIRADEIVRETFSEELSPIRVWREQTAA